MGLLKKEAREIQILAETGVLVVVGGPSGIAAAMASARAGRHNTSPGRTEKTGSLFRIRRRKSYNRKNNKRDPKTNV